MKHVMAKFLSDESGATAVEYALIVGVVATAVIGLGTNFKTALSELWGRLNTMLGTITFDKKNGVQ